MNVKQLKEYLEQFEESLEVCCAEEYGILTDLTEECFSIRKLYVCGEDKVDHLVIAG